MSQGCRVTTRRQFAFKFLPQYKSLSHQFAASDGGATGFELTFQK